MKAASLGVITGSLVLLGPEAVPGAEQSRLVKAEVFIAGGLESFRHQVTVRSKDPARQVVSVLVGELPGLPEKPVSLNVPGGWEGRVLERMRPGWVAWALEVVCQGESSDSEAPGGAETATTESCGLHAGRDLKFEFSLSYAADDLRWEPIFISFSDGRTGIASR
jgi:hypothetical protein